MDCSLLGSSVHGIFQATVVERVAISFSRGSSRPRDGTRVSPRCRQMLYCLSQQGSPMWLASEPHSSASAQSRHGQGLSECILNGLVTPASYAYDSYPFPLSPGVLSCLYHGSSHWGRTADQETSQRVGFSSRCPVGCPME